ncbi:MAG: glycosyltransferase family 4 protein [Rhizomicrobium sp.]
MIVVTTQCFQPDVGGIEAYVTGLADALTRRGHRICVYCDATNAKAAHEFDGARSYSINRFGGPRPWRRRRKARMITGRIRLGGVRIVIADSWKSLELLSPDVLTGTRVICLAHGAELLAARGSSKEAKIIKSFGKATLVAANSQFTANLVRPLISGKTKVRVVLPGVETPLGAPRELPSRTRPPGRRLLTIARFEPYKGVDTVLRSLSALQESYPDMVYDVVGDGRDRNRLISLAHSLGVTNRVCFHGKISDRQKADLLSRADVFVLPNRHEPGEVEGFGIVFAEAAAFGLPAIAGRDGGTGDAVTDGKTGLIVDGADTAAVQNALTTLLDNPEIAREMGYAGYNRFWSEFVWDTAITRFEAALYEPLD